MPEDIPNETNNTSSPAQPSIPALPDSSIRESFINTAISFLQNSKVKQSGLLQKQNFLRSKGLTENEIQIACERAGVFSTDPNASTVINMGTRPQNYPMAVQTTSITTLQKIREVLTSTALLAGIVYAIYEVYQRFIEPLLFGRKKKKRTVDEALGTIEQKFEQNITELNREVIHVRDEIRNQEDVLFRELRSFKNDIDAIKGLLLNRKQFSSPVVPPSIPIWQLQSQQSTTVDATNKIDDNGSADGSGGSIETDIVTKNSDSSLEIIS